MLRPYRVYRLYRLYRAMLPLPLISSLLLASACSSKSTEEAPAVDAGDPDAEGRCQTGSAKLRPTCAPMLDPSTCAALPAFKYPFLCAVEKCPSAGCRRMPSYAPGMDAGPAFGVWCCDKGDY